MKKIVALVVLIGFVTSGCIVPPGQVKKQCAPGQMKKTTGVNPASCNVK